MKFILFFILSIEIHTITQAQNGYVKLTSNEEITGFIKQIRSIKTGEPEIEVWLSKKDKDPKTYSLDEVIEYAIRKDTFQVLTNLYPFEDKELHFDIVPAQVLARGKVDLLVIHQINNPTVSQAMGGGLIPALIDESRGNYNGPLFILSCKSKNMIGGVKPQKDEFVLSVNEYFKDNFSLMKKIINHEYKFKHLKSIVNEYND